MPKRTSKTGGELFIVDNSDDGWKMLRYLRDWCNLPQAIDIATGFFEIGSLLTLDGQRHKLDKTRIVLGDGFHANARRLRRSIQFGSEPH